MFEVISQYGDVMSRLYLSGVTVDMGTTEIKLLLLDLSGGNEMLTAVLTLSFSIAALISMCIVFSRNPRWEIAHFAMLALFSLWSVYHRTYDSVACLLPAALLTDLLIKKRFVGFSRFWLAGLGLLIVSISGRSWGGRQ